MAQTAHAAVPTPEQARKSRLGHAVAGCLLQLLLLGGTAGAAASDEQAGESAPDPQSGEPDKTAADDKLLGDLGGLRPWLDGFGATLEISETGEILGNPTGGLRRGALYEGLTEMSLHIDLRRTLHVRGEILARAYQIHGRGLSANNLGNLAPVSGIEASRTTRLFELWYELPLREGLDIRLGQQAAGTEFLVSTTAQLFVHSTLGWPDLPALDLPSGGPTYPLATPGIRVKATPSDELTVLLGLFNGDPAGPGPGDPQLRDASGTAFRINDGAFVIAEVQYKPDNSYRGGTYKLGGWFHSESFPDLRFDANGVSLASPASSGVPRLHRRNYSLYATVDQPVWRDAEAERGLTLFARAMGAPSDRNLLDFYMDAGVGYSGPFGRKDDAAGIGFSYARIGGAARGLDADRARLTGQPYPIRSAELVMEITYRLRLAPWWQLQPDFQYVINPGGGIFDPNRPGRRLGDAAVLGLRTTVTF